MRVVFLGTPHFALPSLAALIASDNPKYQVVGVITQPDRPAGRGQKLASPPVKVIAEQAEIPILQPKRLRNNPQALEFLHKSKPDLNVVVAFGQLLPREFFDFPPLGSVNVHASLLPRYRGAAPIVHALLQGEQTTGVTIMKIDEGMDTGDILSQAPVSIGEGTTAGELEELLARKGAELLLETLPGYATGEIQPQPQDDERATYASQLHKEEARLDWMTTAAQVHNRIRAFNPWPGAFADFHGQPVKIWRSRRPGEPVRLAGRPGAVLAVGQDEIVVECGEGSILALLELQLPDRRRLPAHDFANGVNLQVGEVFA